MPGRLFLVATPIGNLADVSARALETLRTVDFIVCEDTRHSERLFAPHGIGKPKVSLPAFAEGQRAHAIVERLAKGESAALVTDAGSPAISDPGERLVSEALAAGVEVVPVPGASALIAALSASGLPTGRFHFLGFLPREGVQARAMLEEVAPLRATLVLYEAPNRTAATLELLHEVLGPRRAVVARELTKVHEQFVRGTLGTLEVEEARGEVVLLVEGRSGDQRWSDAEVTAALREGLAKGDRLKSLSTEVAGRAGWTSKDVYRLGLGLKGND
ncbi:MAG: 16S rRNA (cytidine(1402)-2'-O)-methyltransferase [Archangiaceae bacterium]|nr:16S rRNA (cytidine(1402)-2'-O)-methyltransferase [Archangiaceae bacterium]